MKYITNENCDNCRHSKCIYLNGKFEDDYNEIGEWIWCEILESPHHISDYCKNFEKYKLPF